MIVTIIACVVLTFLSGWYSGMETGLYRFNRLRGRLQARSGDRRASRLACLLDDQRLVIAVLLIGTNLWNYLAASVVAFHFTHQGQTAREAELYTTLVLTPVLFVFGETVPKAWFYHRPNLLMLYSHRVLWGSYWLVKLTGLGHVLGGLAIGMLALTRRLSRQGAVGGADSDADELGNLLRESHAEGALSAVQTDIAERILALPERRVQRVMVPIHRVVAVPASVDRQGFAASIRGHLFFGIPVYEGDKGHMVGVVNTDAFLAQSDRPVSELIEPIVTLGMGRSLLDALDTMRNRRARLAVVQDHQDRAVGIVTLSDLVKYLLGR